MIASSAESIGAGNAGAPGQLFVINLAASTSPMALSNPTSPELKRFTFFVSRQREDGRERFRLHMGYFSTQDEAEALLAAVRDIYPAAWAGPAPTTGKSRRGRIAPGSVIAAVPAPVAASAPAIAEKPGTSAPLAGKTPPAAVGAAKVPPAAAPPSVGSRMPAVPAALAAPALDTMSNVRDVLAQLSEGPPAAAAPARPAAPPARTAAVARPTAPAPVAQPRELSGADALSLLESPMPRPAVPAAPAAAAPAPPPRTVPALPPLKNPFAGLENEPEVRLVTPEDTQTLTDIKVDRQNNAPPCFAVQLIWSVSPIDVAALPHLAIFDAYTLYNVEGNRQGRKWFGLRLGFFSDPNSATQVANYVRSDYKNVAVVPVAVKERDRAKGGTAAAPAAGEPQKTSDRDFRREGMEGFELLADDRPPPAKRDLDDTVRVQRPATAAVAPSGAPKATGKPTGKRVVARRRAPPAPPAGKTVSAGVGGAEVLESTLEILGASTLSLEDGGREVITDAAGRTRAPKSSGGNRFSRLLSKLSGG